MDFEQKNKKQKYITQNKHDNVYNSRQVSYGNMFCLYVTVS